MKTILLTLVALVLFVACKKDAGPPEPVADFTATEDGFGAVQFIATATDATTYNWDFGDGNSDSSSPTPLHVYKKNGTFNVYLRVDGPGGNTVVAKAVVVKGVRGSAMFWKASGTRSLEVYVDDQYVGVTINNYPQGARGCGLAGTATVDKLTEGVHRFRAKEQSGLLPRTYEGNFVIIAGQCTPVQIATAR